MFQIKEQDKTQNKDFNEMEISNLTNKKIKITVIKMFIKLGGRVDEQSENFNKDRK